LNHDMHFILVFAILAGLSIKLVLPLRNWIKVKFAIKGEMFMSVITMVTSCLVGAGVCGDCDSGEKG